jgi:hypothetical protein
MTDTRIAEAANVSPALRHLWFYYLSFALPLVFLIGVPSIFITRSIFYAYYPDQFFNDSPTISGTASHSPSGDFFLWAMLMDTLCIFISWTLISFMNGDRLSRLAHPERPSLLVFMGRFAVFAGMAAGFFLSLLGLYTLNNGHDVHMFSSWAFYISQVLAIILDTFFVFWLARLCGEHMGPIEHFGRRCRVALGSVIFVLSLCFLYLYEVRDFLPKAELYPVQLLFVASEYALAICCFAYPLTVFAEVRRHYREIAPTL